MTADPAQPNGHLGVPETGNPEVDEALALAAQPANSLPDQLTQLTQLHRTLAGVLDHSRIRDQAPIPGVD